MYSSTMSLDISFGSSVVCHSFRIMNVSFIMRSEIKQETSVCEKVEKRSRRAAFCFFHFLR
jgi:hypothetical protein